MLKSKYRFYLLLAIVATVASASLVNQIAVALNINPQDPLLFDKTHFAHFIYNDGFGDKLLDLQVAQVASTWANVSIYVDTIPYWMNITHTGLYESTDRNTIFWLHVPNPLTSGVSFGITIGTVFNVTDPVGLIGLPRTNYTGIVEDKLVYWPLEMHLHGAQAAFWVTFYNASNNAMVGRGLYDITCGMLFVLEGGSPFSRLILVETSYEISRNRMMSWTWALGLSVGITIIAYFYMKKKTQLDDDTIREITLLMGAGVAVLMVDIHIDVWFYAYFGFLGNVLIHLSVAIGLAIICLYQGYKLKCIIPALLEIAFLIPMVYATGDPYVPLLTAAMGLLSSWIIMIFLSGYPKPPKASSKWDQIISEFL